jgi:hypothetical protein
MVELGRALAAQAAAATAARAGTKGAAQAAVSGGGEEQLLLESEGMAAYCLFKVGARRGGKATRQQGAAGTECAHAASKERRPDHCAHRPCRLRAAHTITGGARGGARVPAAGRDQPGVGVPPPAGAAGLPRAGPRRGGMWEGPAGAASAAHPRARSGPRAHSTLNCLLPLRLPARPAPARPTCCSSLCRASRPRPSSTCTAPCCGTTHCCRRNPPV